MLYSTIYHHFTFQFCQVKNILPWTKRSYEAQGKQMRVPKEVIKRIHIIENLISLFLSFSNKGNYSQCHRGNEISGGETNSSIAFGKVTSSSVKWEISPNCNHVVTSHTWEVDNGTCSQSNAGTDSSILVQVLKFHLLRKSL